MSKPFFLSTSVRPYIRLFASLISVKLSVRMLGSTKPMVVYVKDQIQRSTIRIFLFSEKTSPWNAPVPGMKAFRKISYFLYKFHNLFWDDFYHLLPFLNSAGFTKFTASGSVLVKRVHGVVVVNCHDVLSLYNFYCNVIKSLDHRP